MNDIFKIAEKFEKLVAQKVSAQPGEIQRVLEKTKIKIGSKTVSLWSIDNVYAAMDSMKPPYKGKATGVLMITPSGGVGITVKGPRAGALKVALGGHLSKMSAAIKKAKKFPAENMNLPWFENTG